MPKKAPKQQHDAHVNAWELDMMFSTKPQPYKRYELSDPIFDMNTYQGRSAARLLGWVLSR